MPRHNPNIPMGIRLSPPQKEWLEQASLRLDRPVTWLIRRLVEKAMKQGSFDRPDLVAE